MNPSPYFGTLKCVCAYTVRGEGIASSVPQLKYFYLSSSGFFSKCPLMALRIMVFLPINTIALPRRAIRIS